MNDEIVIISGGSARFIYDDELVDLLTEGPSNILRVSFVEPEKGGWVATMIDGSKLGPFKTRKKALDAEREYVEERMFK